jgi:hypothetical protein
MITGGFIPAVKQKGLEADHLPPSSAEVIVVELYFPSPSSFPGKVLN